MATDRRGGPDYMKRGPQYISNVMAQAAARLCFMLSTALIFIVCARMLGINTFGEFAYIMAYITIVGVIADSGTTILLSRELASRKNDASISSYFGTFILFRVALGCFAAIVSGIVGLFLVGHDETTLLLASVAAPFGAARFFDPVFQVFQQPWRGLPVALGTSLLYLVGSFGVLITADDPIPGLIVVYGLTGVGYIAMAFWLSRHLLRPQLAWNSAMMRGMAMLALPIAVGSFFAAANSRIGTLLLAQMASSTVVGHYAAAAKLVELGGIVVGTLAAPLLPILVTAAASHDGLRRAARSLFEAAAIFGFPAVILFWHMAPWLLTSLFGHSFIDAEPITRILVWQLALVPFAIVGSAILLTSGSIHFSYWTAATATAVNGLLITALAPSTGAISAAIGALAAEFVVVGILFFYLLRDVGAIFEPITWFKIALLNIGFFTLLLHPILENIYANAGLAILLYFFLVLFGKVVPHRHLRSIFSHPATEHS